MGKIILSEIWRYPVKSLRGAPVDSLDAGARGLVFDRHWMLVDHRGEFLTQRQMPSMVLIRASLQEGQLVLAAPGMTDLIVGRVSPQSPRLRVRVWQDECAASAPDPAADGWLTEFLGLHCRLVELPENTVRKVDPAYADPADQVGFADGFPFLLISQASLDDLNDRLPAKLPMERFRPNLVVTGCEAYAEDGWRSISIGGMVFRVAKPCSRCVIPTVDPETGARSGQEPLTTLATYRTRDNKVYFGQNLIHTGTGRLAVGMQVEILG